MYLHLDNNSREPIYQQIFDAIKHKIACGELAADERLPSSRTLAKELKINPRTVVNAYEELKCAGLVVMRQGQGTFVASNQGVTPQSVLQEAIGDMAQCMLTEAFRLGARKTEVLEIIESEANKMESES